MTTTTAAPAGTGRPRTSGFAGLGALTRSELRLFLRDRAGAVATLLFPTVLLVVLGLIPSFKEPVTPGGPRLIDLYVPIMVAMVLAVSAVQALPAVVATYREQGLLRRMRTTPVRPQTLLLAITATMLGVTLVSTILVLLVARLAFGVPLPQDLAAYLVTLVLLGGAVYGLGLLVAAVAPSGRTGNAIGTVLFFPLMFFGGLWLPRDVMPEVLRTISDYTPLGAGAGALQAAAAGSWPQLLHLGVLLAWTVLTGLLATRLFRWE
ncbi:ABC transporter permease [Pseudonocardia sp. D17]|uniref:ABC transporter permease n=1 Tax=Pseudonocardia sp. D17 TaxID=882661 RepID=UPI002B3C51F4|nr:transport permease protein [Pseudonocardia sp. D17]